MKQFSRWMRGTCIECQPLQAEAEDELVTFTFLSEVWHNPQLVESATTVSQNIQLLLRSVDEYLHHWQRYQPLWENDKTTVVEKFAAMSPSCVMCDKELQIFSNVKEEVMQEPLCETLHIIHLNLEPLAQTIQEMVESWISSLGCSLIKPAKEDVFNLTDELMVLNHATVCQMLLL